MIASNPCWGFISIGLYFNHSCGDVGNLFSRVLGIGTLRVGVCNVAEMLKFVTERVGLTFKAPIYAVKVSPM